MREIIFKARREDNGDWIEGNYHHNLRKAECHLISSKNDNIPYKVYRDSLMMKDYNGEWINV